MLFRSEGKPVDANVQASNRRKLGGTDVKNLSIETVEKRGATKVNINLHSKACRRTLYPVKPDKPLMDNLLEQRTTV